jgi:hypothetical protein
MKNISDRLKSRYKGPKERKNLGGGASEPLGGHSARP